MNMDSSTGGATKGELMSANILVIEYEPRYVEHVQKALAPSGHRLEVVGDIDAAVDRCAHFEPTVVIITSVLPNLKIEDAITQLRGRAGLRVTPFLILMSGYRGEDPKSDAGRYGAQDILERPFGSQDLADRVHELVVTAPSSAATQAIPEDMLAALRRSAGLTGDGSSMTSDELFADILSDVEGGEQQPVKPPQDRRPPTAAKSTSVDKALADILDAGKAEPRPRRQTSVEADVDALLSQTLSGLDLKPSTVPAPPRTETAPPAPRPGAPAAHAEPAPAGAEPPSAAAASGPPRRRESVSGKAPSPPAGNFGQYVIEEHIATGGMADVYKARMMGMEGFQKTVAIKRILSNLTDNAEFVKMFIDEAKLAAQLNHNNIIHIYDLGKIDHSHYIAMEFIEGRDLRSILQECRERGLRVPIDLALYIATLLASALDYAHKKRDFENRDLGLVHRDVSPQNVLISTAGDVKLCDFGIAKAASKASHTRAGALKGKLQYMSPEQAWGKNIDHRSDIFSLGLVLYEMLTSEQVFSGDSELSVLEQVRNPKVAAPSARSTAIPAEVDRCVLRALHPARENRYQSAKELQQDLEEIMREHGWSPDNSALSKFLSDLESGRAGQRVEEPLPDTVGVPPPLEPPTGERERAEVPDAQPEEIPEIEILPEPEVVAANEQEPPYAVANGGRKRLWFLFGLLLVVAVAAGLWWFFGQGGRGMVAGRQAPPVVPVITETPTPAAEESLLTEEEMLAKAREVAAQEIAKQEEDLRKRLEEEFPTPTPIPPTATATETETPTPSPTPTETPLPPTATPLPPTPTPVPPTPTPSVREGDIVEMGNGVTRPVAIFKEDPAYPALAREMRVEGSVDADVLVGIDGAVEQVRILDVSRTGVGFEKATEEALRQWRFKPATKNGVKVRMWMKVHVPFKVR